MKKLLVLTGFNLLAALICSGQITTVKTDYQYGQKFSKTQLTDDINFLVHTLENVHPNLFHSISKHEYYQLKDSVLGLLKDGMTRKEVYPLAARLIGAVNEGHTGLNDAYENRVALDSGWLNVFPFTIAWFDGRYFYVNYNLSSDAVNIKTGDKIVSINGLSSQRIYDLITSGTGGLRVQKERTLNNFFIYLSLFNVYPPYDIEVAADNSVRKIQHEGIKAAEYYERLRRTQQQPVAEKKDYEFTRLEDNVGLVSFRRMVKPDSFETFLQETFTEIKNNPVSGLIIDLRENGGGNSSLGRRLLEFITAKPFRMAGGSQWKVSSEYKDYLLNLPADRKNWYRANKAWDQYFSMPDGSLLEEKYTEPHQPGPNPLRYPGKVCFLIGPVTFSSANMLANAVQDFQLATLIGEPTGEPANDYGEVYSFSLPHTQMRFRTSTTLWIRANGDAANPDPVLPDIKIKQKEEDKKEKKDSVLKFAKQWCIQ